MEQVRIRSDNNSSPHPTEDPATPFDQKTPLLSTPNWGEYDSEDSLPPEFPPPSTADSQHPDDRSWFSSLNSLKFVGPGFEPQQSKPPIRGFERPRFSHIALLAALCLITYPAFYILTLVAKDRSLFIVRAIVSVWCSGAGFALGYVLLSIGARHMEAASEFKLVEFRIFLTNYFKQPGLP